MTIKSLFFESVSGDRTYNSGDFREWLKGIISNGTFVSPANNLQVLAGTGMSVNLQVGKAWIEGCKLDNPSILPLTISQSETTLDRIDRIILRFDNTVPVRAGDVFILTGVPGSTPVAPSLTRTETIYEIALADISVKKLTTAITQAMITDKRFDETVCGIVKGLVSEIETSDLFAQYQSEFETWFLTAQNTLSDDVAGNLLVKIDDNSTDILAAETAIEAVNTARAAEAAAKKIVFGAKLSGDLVTGPGAANNSILNVVPLKDACPGMFKTTNFAEIAANSRIKIKKTGLYTVSAQIHISDGTTSVGTYHCGLVRDGSGVLIAENYVHTSTYNPNICSGNVCATVYLQENEYIRFFVTPPSATTWWRLSGTHTALVIVPIAFI